MTTLTGIRINTTNTLEQITINTDHRDIANAINCHTLDVVTLPTAHIDLWCDDEALLTTHPQRNWLATHILAHLEPNKPPRRLYGAILALTYNTDGETLSLTPEQITTINNATTAPITPNEILGTLLTP